VFPEKELQGLSPNCRIHVSVRDLYIPRVSVHIFSGSRTSRPILGIHKSLKRHMNVEIGTEAAQLLSGNMCFEFSALCLCSAVSHVSEGWCGPSPPYSSNSVCGAAAPSPWSGQPAPQPKTSHLQSPYHWLLLVAFPQSPRRLVAGIVMAVASATAKTAPACISSVIGWRQKGKKDWKTEIAGQMRRNKRRRVGERLGR
jgi:hypothetical protein